MRKYNIGISIFLCLLAGGIFYWSEAFKTDGGSTDSLGPAFWPRTLACFMVLLAIALVIETIIQWKVLSTNPINFKSPGMKRTYFMCAIILIFAILLKFTGFYIAAIVMIPGCMVVLGEKRPKHLVFITVGILTSVYVIFGLILNLTLPTAF